MANSQNKGLLRPVTPEEKRIQRLYSNYVRAANKHGDNSRQAQVAHTTYRLALKEYRERTEGF